MPQSSTKLPLFTIKVEQKGRIHDVRDCVVRIDGLKNCMVGEILELGENMLGMVMEFDASAAMAVALGDTSFLRTGATVRGQGKPLNIAVGSACLGRMFTPLGVPCDGAKPISSPYHEPVLRMSKPLHARKPIFLPLHTGTRVIDMLCPVGRGQRLLVLGDRMTGKTSVALDAVLSQRESGVVCVYCAVGKSVASLERVMGMLKARDALSHTCVVVATDNMSVAEQYLAPFTAMTVAEHFASEGADVLVVHDDLTKHAWAYRQVALLLDRPPGREAYPGDIFYVQTQLFERAGCFDEHSGGGSISLVALAETQQEDMTAYIPSNLISMCDGYVNLSSSLAGEGVHPPVDVALSTSTVGGRVQPQALRQLGGSLRADYIRYLQLSGLSQLSSGLSEEGARTLEQGERIRAIFKQAHHRPSSLPEQLFLLFALQSGTLGSLTVEEASRFCMDGFSAAVEQYPDLAGTGLDGEELNTAELTAFERGVGCALKKLFPESSEPTAPPDRSDHQETKQ